MIAPVTSSEAFRYRVAITNALGDVMSEAAVLTVAPTLDWASIIYVEKGETNAVVRVWRVADGASSQVLSWTNRPAPVAALAFSPDDRTCSTGEIGPTVC